MKEITNRFGTGILYEESDLGKNIYCVCTACMSVWSDFLSFANAEANKGKGGKCVAPYFVEENSNDVLNPTDTIVVLGCQVTDLAIYNDLKTAEELHKQHPNTSIYMGGCLAQRFDIELPSYLKRLDVVRKEYVDLKYVTGFIDYKKPFWNRELKENDDEFAVGNLFRHMYPLKIGAGCHGKCKYCTIRDTRGKTYHTDLNEHLEDGMVVNVKGNIGYSEYEDNVTVKKEITSIVLSKVEDEADFKATFTQTILLGFDSIGKKDPEKNTIALNAYVVDYVGKPKIDGKKVEIKKNVTYPKTFEVAINDNPEITAKMLQKFFKVKKKGSINVLTVMGNLIEGAAIVNITDDDIPDDIKELIEMGLYSEEEAKAKCAVGGNNRERRMVILKPDITYVGQDDERKPTVAFEEAKYEDTDLYFYEQALNDAGVEVNDTDDGGSDSDEVSEEDDLLAMLDNM